MEHRRVGQLLGPVALLPLQQLALQIPALPLRVVRVLDRQRRQRVRLLLREGVVQRQQLLDQQVHRPAIGHDVVHHQRQ
jgi:hypothetical protein